VQRSRPSSSPVFQALFSDDDTELLLESALAQVNHKSTDKNSGPHHDQDEKQYLLEGVDNAEIDGAQARKSHRADHKEQTVDVPSTRCGSACSPEDYRRDHACHYEVSIV